MKHTKPYQTVYKILSNHKEARYIVAGATSELVELVSFYLLYTLLNRLYVANSLSFLLGVLSGFIFHKLWSFAGEHRFKTRHQFIGYVVLAIFNFIMINILVGYFVNRLHIQPLLAKFVAITITVTWTFVITNKFIFRHKQTSMPSSDN